MANKQTTTEFGAYHLASDKYVGEYQPIRTNNFRFLVTDEKFQNLLRVGGNEDDSTDYISTGQEILDFSVIKFDVPHFSQDPINVQRGNSTIKFAGKASWKEGTLTINDFAGDYTRGRNGISVLEAWQALSYDPVNDTIASAADYKMTAQVLEYLPDNTLVRYWDLYGCWISDLSEDGWDNESSNKKTVQAKITYDYAIPHTPDEL